MAASAKPLSTADVDVTPERARELFASLAEHFEAARAAVALIDRDLLPRSASGPSYLVCGIVGPNNAGKSALFNALVGRDLSPSDPTGGATRRLVGVAHPDLIERLRHSPHTSRFRIDEGISAGADTLATALSEPEDPADLTVVGDATVPDHLMLIDTPDFDSIFVANRGASEALLAVADIVVVVVTRHSYQNRAVVDFFRTWLRHGRPWILVYNEAVDDAVASAHAEKVCADVASRPLAAFWAPHSLEVQSGQAPLTVLPLTLASAADGEALAGRNLRDVLFDVEQSRDIKAKAFAASWERLREYAADVLRAIERDNERAHAVESHARAITNEAGLAVASRAMPAGPFVDAFRVVLDRRSNVFSRSWRTLVRGVRVGLERIPRLLGARGSLESAAEAKLDEIERDTLAAVWPEAWERLVRDLGPEARAPARRQAPDGVCRALDADLAQDESNVRAAAARRMAEQRADLGSFQHACEELIDEAIEARGFDLDIQAAADIATMAPLAFAAVVIFTTTGVGVDIAAAGGGAVGTFLFEKYSHVLGSGITKAARKRWSKMRGDDLSSILYANGLRGTADAIAVGDRRLSSARAALEAVAGRGGT